MTDAVFKRKYTSTNSYKNRRRKLEDRNETEDAASAAPAPASPSTSKIRSKMQTRVGSMVSDGDLCENHTQNNTPIKQPNEQHTHDHNDDDITMPADVDGDTAQSDQPQASSTLSKRTYAKVRSYRNDAPSSNWIDEPVREGYSELRKKWGVDDRSVGSLYVSISKHTQAVTKRKTTQPPTNRSRSCVRQASVGDTTRSSPTFATASWVNRPAYVVHPP